ncbi:MAG: hypothetical protein EBX52_03275 [Proteobacteria bacterium]|nr:hypothetical protein [Pseudomonadota bacterium]
MSIGFLLVLAFPAMAEDDPFKRLNVLRITAKEISKETLEPESLETLHRQFVEECACTPILEQSQDPMSIADIALRVWDIVQDNRAVLNAESLNVKALPILAKDRWEVLTGWKPEHGVEYTLELENLYGINVVTLKYEVNLIYGGNVRGVGRYIASARVIPRHIDVLWGFNLDVRVRETAVQNLGTEKNPFASIKLDVSLGYGSILRQMSETISYRLDANGAIYDLTSGKSFFTSNR